MSKYISYIVASLNHDRSLSSLLNPYDRIKALITRYPEKQAENGFRRGYQRQSNPPGTCCRADVAVQFSPTNCRVRGVAE